MSEVGYSDDKAFREVFKKIVGLSPLDYKARYSSAEAGGDRCEVSWSEGKF